MNAFQFLISVTHCVSKSLPHNQRNLRPEEFFLIPVGPFENVVLTNQARVVLLQIQNNLKYFSL